MKKIIQYFKREILPYIILGMLGIATIGVVIFLYWLDKVRFIN